MDASTNIDLPVDSGPAKEAPAVEQEEQRSGFNFDEIRKSPAFVPGVAILVGILAAFWPLLNRLPSIWFGEDGYYSHGILVPVISGYVVYRWWPWIKSIPVKPAYIAVVPLIAILWVTRASTVNQVDSLTSVCLIFAVLFGVAFVGGWRWMGKVTLPTLYLAFALPIWNMAITYYTNPLQVFSTKVAFKMLEYTGFHPFRDANIIYLDGFTLDVGVPCSGLKLVLALFAFTIFFALIARLKWWANGLLVALALPLALFINGLRIMMIGVVGVNYGPEAGHKFHDYSGYIALIVCFFILFRIARWLGWKD